MPNTVRYTAVIKVIKIESNPGTGRGDDKEFNTELASVTARSKDLASLLEKVSAHVALVEDV